MTQPVKLNLLLMMILAALNLTAAEIKIIANPSVVPSSVSTEDLKSIFLITKTSLSDGSHVEPVLTKTGSVHESFLKGYLAKSDSALQTYYRSLVFTGKGSMPKILAADSDVVSYVAKTKGAIGYVGSATATPGVKILEIK